MAELYKRYNVTRVDGTPITVPCFVLELRPDSPATTWSFSAKIIAFTTPYGGVDADLQWDVTFQLTSTITKG